MSAFADFFAGHPFWGWAALGAALLAIEILTGSGWLLWPAASAGVVAVLAAFAGLPTPWALLVFAILTIASTALARRYLPRRTVGHEDDINDNIGRLIGHHGKAVSTFRDRSGRVFIDGKEWAAELQDGDTLEAGGRVEVVGVTGARLKVRGG